MQSFTKSPKAPRNHNSTATSKLWTGYKQDNRKCLATKINNLHQVCVVTEDMPRHGLVWHWFSVALVLQCWFHMSFYTWVLAGYHAGCHQGVGGGSMVEGGRGDGASFYRSNFNKITGKKTSHLWPNNNWHKIYEGISLNDFVQVDL